MANKSTTDGGAEEFFDEEFSVVDSTTVKSEAGTTPVKKDSDAPKAKSTKEAPREKKTAQTAKKNAKKPAAEIEKEPSTKPVENEKNEKESKVTSSNENVEAANKDKVEDPVVVVEDEDYKPEGEDKVDEIVEETPNEAENEKIEEEEGEDHTEVDTELKNDDTDNSKMNGSNVDIKSDSLLIITDDDLDAELITTVDKPSESENDASKNNSTIKESAKPKSGDDAKEKGDSKKTGDVWVSNITRHVKATDLKKHFSRVGKVLTAKIVTNGKSFFGYIVMENPDVANKCVKNLSGSMFDKRKIAVSRQRPDAQKRASVKIEKKSTENEKKSEDSKRKSVDSEKKTDSESTTKKTERDKIPVQAPKKSADDKKIELLRRDNVKLKGEVTRLRRYLGEEQRRFRAESSRNRKLERDIKDLELKLRDERRKFDREREAFDKTTRSDRVKMEADRNNIKKELDEVKKLREYLKRKLEEDVRSTSRRSRGHSPYYQASKRFREDGEKSSKYMEERNRTPPSPPKLSTRKRSPNDSSFMMEKDRRQSSHHFDLSDGFEKESSRHSSSLVLQSSKPAVPAAPRNIWPSTFHQDVWRMGPSNTSSAPFSSVQYPRQSSYHSPAGGKPSSYSQQRDFNKREHYSNARKY